MTDEQFNSITEKLDKALKLLEQKAQNTGNTPKTGNNAPKRELKSLTGVVRWSEVKQGKRGQFLVFKLSGTQDGEISCNIWDESLIDGIVDGMKIEAEGCYSNWGQYSNFTVRAYNILEAPLREDAETQQPTIDEPEDDMPF